MDLTQPKPECNHDDHSHPGQHSNPTRQYESTHFDHAAGMFRMLGDASRLRILHQLSAGERCVSELAELLGETVSTISSRLRLLKSEKLVEYRRVGKHIYYSLADSHITQMVLSGLDHAEHA